jgi:hypothetical protein
MARLSLEDIDGDDAMAQILKLYSFREICDIRLF